MTEVMDDVLRVDDLLETDGLLQRPRIWPGPVPEEGHGLEGSVDERPGTVRDLARSLAEAEILDPDTVRLPGAAVVLPWGVAILRQFRGMLDELFEAAGYEEYELPEIAPEDIYQPAVRAFPGIQRLLRVGSDDEWRAGTPRGVLSPTGEATVYAHWARTVRTSHDLPIYLRRAARYFRPVPSGSHSGRGLFRPMEAPDVHEFHACLPDEPAAARALGQALELTRAACERARVPVLWSLRPPWGNHGEVSRRCFGGDTPLPVGGTVQVGCVYDQGQIFSRAYGIRLRDGGQPSHPYHITGCVTRRLVLAHVYQNLDASGRLLLHPDVAPVEVVVLAVATDAHLRLARALETAGVRVRSEVHPDKRALRLAADRWWRRGVPVRVLVQPPRAPDDPIRVVITGPESEAAYKVTDASAVASAVRAAVQAARSFSERRLAERAGQKVVPALGDARECVARGQVVIAPVVPAKAALAEITIRLSGEVLGMRQAPEPAPCQVTERPTQARALVARRI
jgi:hypothetical protein